MLACTRSRAAFHPDDFVQHTLVPGLGSKFCNWAVKWEKYRIPVVLSCKKEVGENRLTFSTRSQSVDAKQHNGGREQVKLESPPRLREQPLVKRDLWLL